MFTDLEKSELRSRLMAWYAANRRDLPWRGASAYAVWVSEIMLQQTQVAAVVPFFGRFLARYPDVVALAAAPVEDVLHAWAGLGYYARARNLHRAARIVADRYEGMLPTNLRDLQALPGIGRYTAGAILSIAYGLRYPVVDSNVARVLCRLAGLRGDPASSSSTSRLWSLAESLVPAVNPGDFNQALMELGALVCLPGEPACGRCPLRPQCTAGQSADPTALPEYRPGRSAITVVHAAAVVGNETGQLLIAQRPLDGLWGGLWEFPRVVCLPGEPPDSAAERAAQEIVGLEVNAAGRIASIRHSVTHHRITLYAFDVVRTGSVEPEPLGCERIAWADVWRLEEYAFSSPQATLAREVIRGQQSLQLATSAAPHSRNRSSAGRPQH